MQKKLSSLRLLIAAGAALLAAQAASLPAFASEAAARAVRPHQAWGYQPWWLQRNWPAINLGVWDRIIFFELRVDADGRVDKAALPAGWRKMSRAAARCGSALDLSFTLFDERKFERLFSSRRSRDTLLHEIAAFVKEGQAEGQADGVHLDFEIFARVSPQSIAGFREFVARLHDRLRAETPAKQLSVFGVVGAAQDLFDAATLQKVDFVVVQGYDAHWTESRSAGSVAPLRGRHQLNWEKSLQHYLALGAERSRLLFSLPYYGYEWPVVSAAAGSATAGHGDEITYAPLPRGWVPKISRSALAQSRRHGVARDAETGSPYYAYRDGGGQWRQGWFEDEESLTEKLAFIQREGLLGAAAFPLGYDGGAFDPLLASAFGKRPDCYSANLSGTRPSRPRAADPGK